MNIQELKKGDTVIVKNSQVSLEQGLERITGDIFSLDLENSHFSIRCKETDSIVKIDYQDGKIFLIS